MHTLNVQSEFHSVFASDTLFYIYIAICIAFVIALIDVMIVLASILVLAVIFMPSEAVTVAQSCTDLCL